MRPGGSRAIGAAAIGAEAGRVRTSRVHSSREISRRKIASFRYVIDHHEPVGAVATIDAATHQ